MRDQVTGLQGHDVPRHVWVCRTGRWQERSPGLILEWRRVQGHWEALVVWASGGGVRAWELAHGWVRAEHVRPRE
ncbi:hypothetical protein GHK92_15270 [Nocardioides sp. dk4132]|uniref:hypothetical protein n=1 Tax=unclassified Nocardioides TaxID=2615069 RepID=UPI001294A180|nr:MULTISPECIES: hypothetical protein [unclassified Nocardioides]MQW77233.1 hypothetical protein [Nocardioides sp. dk4132]QGA07992.1 hypothetical protein GFH29_11745 [Nocardioides sp. dk884]